MPVVLNEPPTTSTQATLGKLGLWHDTVNDANHLYHLAYITTSDNLTSYHWEECVLVSNAGQAGGVVTIGQDGKISASILPLPGNSTLGGVAVSSTGVNGVSVSNTGALSVEKASNAEIDAMTDDYKAIVPSNLDYAVAAALTGTNHMTLTTAQQAIAQEVLGVTGGGGGGGLEPSTGHGAPTGSTAAVYGQLYKDVDTNKVYLCINAVTQNSVTTTTWLELVLSDQKGAVNGVASLGSDGKVPSAQLPTIPTQLSQLTEDTTHRVVTDAEKTAWNNKSDFSGSYNDLSNKPTIPTALSQLTDDATHRLVTDTEKTAWDNKSNFSGSYTDLTDKPTIPSTAADVGAIPDTEKGAVNGVAELDAEGKVPSTQLHVAGASVLGSVKVNQGGAGLQMTGEYLQIAKAQNADIDAKSSGYKPLVPNAIDYAVRSVLPNVTVIPAATSDYSLVDSSATTNAHSHVYTHVPTTAPTYRLPAVTDTTIVHYIELTVDFTTVQTYSFLDSNGDAVTPLFTPTVSSGDVYTFKCEYSTVKSAWLVYPQKQGATSSDFVMKSEVGVANGVAPLNNNSTVPLTNLRYADQNYGGILHRINATHGLESASDWTQISRATNSDIDNRTSPYKPIVPLNLNYAMTAALTDSDHITLTALQQAVAKEVLGIQDSGGVEPTMGSGAPTSSTTGLYGQLYKDTVTSKMYLCVNVTADETDPDNVVMSYTWLEIILSDQKGAANGVASLGSDGKVPSGQLPAIPPAPLVLNTGPTSATVGSLGQVAINTTYAASYKCISVDVDDTDPQNPVTTYRWAEELNDSGGVIRDSGIGFYVAYPGITSYIGALNLVIGPNSDVPATAWYSAIVGEGCTLGADHSECLMVGAGLRTGNAFQFVQGVYNAPVVSAFRIVGAGASNANRRNVEELSTAGDHYIAGGHQQKVTTIPAATSSYTLSEGVYIHTPQTASLYTLPAVSDVARTHICVVTIVFSANVLTYEFQDSNGVTQQPLPMYGAIEPGAVVTFLCRYNPVVLFWSIFPVQEGVIVQS